ERVPASIRGCRLVSYARNRVEIDFDLEGKGLLVLLDAFYPGWRATVDGRERPIHRVAGLFRGVQVTGGEHRLVMTYEPRPFRVGATISLLALLSTLAGIAFCRRTRQVGGAEPAFSTSNHARPGP
ncbi:MAG: YfhO family protein, partial [Candidatus Riflebacteria bacterium]|nr:YfhO family protein [Candidatus Riflebacteria bacterium]